MFWIFEYVTDSHFEYKGHFATWDDAKVFGSGLKLMSYDDRATIWTLKDKDLVEIDATSHFLVRETIYLWDGERIQYIPETKTLWESDFKGTEKIIHDVTNDPAYETEYRNFINRTSPTIILQTPC